MTRRALERGAVNLAQGFPDFSAPEELKQAACDAINADINQYAITWGARPFREAIEARGLLGILDSGGDGALIQLGGERFGIVGDVGVLDPIRARGIDALPRPMLFCGYLRGLRGRSSVG